MSDFSEWLTNDHEDPYAPRLYLSDDPRDREQEHASYLRWRSQLVEGPPRVVPDSGFTVEQLRAMGLVGLYRPSSGPTKE